MQNNESITTQIGNKNNNTSNSYLIINEANNNNNKLENEKNTDSEGLPILPQLETMKLTIEEYYRTYYPECKIIKCYNFLFIKMGRLLTFNFDKNNNYIPKYSIGPHWYLTIVLLIIIIILTLLLYSTIFKFTSSLKQLIYFILILIQFYLVLKTALTHIKIVMNKKKRNIEDSGYCSICQVYFNPKKKVEHCNFCGICAEKVDHHCVWVGKCVAKNNTLYFYGMIVQVVILYIYIIICGIFMAINK